MLITSALICLSLNIYHEARGESFNGQLAVAYVTYNRANHDSKNVCKVIAKKAQFSWVSRDSAENTLMIDESQRPKDIIAWNNAKKVASLVLWKEVDDITNGAKFYHAKTVKPKWAKKMNNKMVLGNHIFYTENKDKV